MTFAPIRAPADLGMGVVKTPKTVANWNGVVQFHPREVVRPMSEEQLVTAIQDSTQVRLVGGGHSMNAGFAADVNTTLVDMTGLNAVGKVQTESDGSHSVWAEGGATLKKLGTELAKQGYALEVLPTSADVTVGGSTANGAHGSNLKGPASMSQQMTGMQLIKSSGEKVTLSQADPDFPLVRTALGSLGAAYKVKFKVVPDFRLRSTETWVDKSILHPENLRAALAQHDHAFFMYSPGDSKVMVRYLDKVPNDGSKDAGAKVKKDYAKTGLFERVVDHEGTKLVSHLPYHSKLRGALDHVLEHTFRARKPSVGESRFMYQENIDHPSHDMSYAVPFDQTWNAIAAVEKQFKDLGYEQHVPFFIRFLKGDTAAGLGMNRGGDRTMIEFASTVEFHDQAAPQKKFEDAMIALGGRPHWGKEFSVNPEAQYPAADWKRFGELAQQWGSKFQNRWSQTMSPAATPPVPFQRDSFG